MNDEEIVAEMRRVAEAKFERYVCSVVEHLNQFHITIEDQLAEPGRCTTYWVDLKTPLAEQPLVPASRLEQKVMTECYRVLDALPADERRILWLASEAADRDRPNWFGETGSNELVADLYGEVKDLA